jgi:anti-sigma regulatory factor (Ser/Thr protein kinase)
MLSRFTSSIYAPPIRRVQNETAWAETNNYLLIEIAGEADADEALRAGANLTLQASLDDSVAERVALVVSEAMANILKHAGQGRMLMRVIEEPASGVEIIALDRGPGITHLGAAMRGGYSTSGGSGVGLRAMSRASNLFDIYSRPGQGVALLAQVWPRPWRHCAATSDPSRAQGRSGVISMARPGARFLSDAWAVKHQPSRSLIMLANGLGQGAEAARAATEAIRVMEEIHALAPAEILEVVHETLDGARGASVAVAEICLSGRAPEVRFAGIGNIAARLVSGDETHHLVSLHGIAGYEAEIREFSYPWRAHSSLIMHSDGLASHWKIEDYPGMLASHPTLIAAVLHRDFNREIDDATVVVAKQ